MITVRGKLLRVVGIGGESTGWAIELDEPVQMSGETIRQVDVNQDPTRWRAFENQRVEAIGQLTIRQGIERQFWPVLEVETVEEVPGAVGKPSEGTVLEEWNRGVDLRGLLAAPVN